MDVSFLGWAIPLFLVIAFLVFKRLSQVAPEAARQLVKDGARLVDVRSPEEYGGGHLPGSINVPLPQLIEKSAKLGPKDAPVVLYCASGTRSALARSQLKRAGFTQVFNLGAMSRW